MKHFRADILYLVGFAVVMVMGYAVATRMATDEEMFVVDPTYRAGDLSLPEYSVELQSVPFAVRAAHASRRSSGPQIPRRRFMDEMESALASVRRALLADSVTQEGESLDSSSSSSLRIVSP